MKTHSAWNADRTAEVGVIEHDGREFTAYGAVISDTHACGYPHFASAENNVTARGRFNVSRERIGELGEMRAWDGTIIGTCRIVASWPIRSHMAERMYQIEATIAGRRYTGRGMGHDMLWRGRSKRSESEAR